jgi:hypothetical protein
MVSSIFIYLGLTVAVHANAPLKCPAETEQKRALALESPGWSTACAVIKGGKALLGAVRAPESSDAAPRLAVAVLSDAGVVRSQIDLKGSESDEISKIPAEEWDVSVRAEKVGKEEWLRVEAIGRGGEDLFSAQGVVALFILEGNQLKHLWTGLGDRAETRFGACQIDTVSTFRILPTGLLQRTRRTTRIFQNPGGSSREAVKGWRKDCIAAPTKRDVFAIGSSG